MSDSRQLTYRERVAALPAGGPPATRRALAAAEGAGAVVLVEGFSDQIAVETLARLRGRDLRAEGVAVVPVGGAHAVSPFLRRFGPQGAGIRVAGLCDAGEANVFRRSLQTTGLGYAATDAAMEPLGFFVCHADLEEELIRALGTAAVEAAVAREGDLDALRTFQRQPAWRGRGSESQLRRFLGSAGRRKLRYARLLVEALEPAAVPRPLDALLAYV
jgi:hypothetical protein